MKKILLTITISMAGLAMFGCSFSFSTNSNTASTSNAAKPANSNTATSASTNKASNSTSKTEAPKTALKDEKKPTDGNAKKAKNNPVPESWIDIYDEQKGYGFSVPEGTTGGSETSGGVDVFVAKTPTPSEIGIFVLAFKDKTLTKEDLQTTAKKFIEEMSEGKATVTMGALKGESDDYSVGDATVKEDGNAIGIN